MKKNTNRSIEMKATAIEKSEKTSLNVEPGRDQPRSRLISTISTLPWASAADRQA